VPRVQPTCLARGDVAGGCEGFSVRSTERGGAVNRLPRFLTLVFVAALALPMVAIGRSASACPTASSPLFVHQAEYSKLCHRSYFSNLQGVEAFLLGAINSGVFADGGGGLMSQCGVTCGGSNCGSTGCVAYTCDVTQCGSTNCDTTCRDTACGETNCTGIEGTCESTHCGFTCIGRTCNVTTCPDTCVQTLCDNTWCAETLE